MSASKRRRRGRLIWTFIFLITLFIGIALFALDVEGTQAQIDECSVNFVGGISNEAVNLGLYELSYSFLLDGNPVYGKTYRIGSKIAAQSEALKSQTALYFEFFPAFHALRQDTGLTTLPLCLMGVSLAFLLLINKKKK